MTSSPTKLDYSSVHGPGVSNFSSSSPRKFSILYPASLLTITPDRLPTISAADALAKLKNSATRCISTGLRDLDAVLQNHDLDSVAEDEGFWGGISRGRVTEIYGPPGVGKTALGMQLAAAALHAGGGVIWVDGSHPVPGPRFSQVTKTHNPVFPAARPSSATHITDLSKNLTHFLTPTLAHLLALLAHQTSNPSQSTNLMVIDGFSTLIANAFPRNPESNNIPKKPGAPKPTSRKIPTITNLLSTLQTLSLTQNLAIVLLTQCITKMRPGCSAELVPILNFPAWELGLGCRVVLFRDWGWTAEDRNFVDIRLAEVLKAEGIGSNSGWRGRIVGFGIGEAGLHSISLPQPKNNTSATTTRVLSPLKHTTTIFSSPSFPHPRIPHKRKLSATELEIEIPDSEAEDDEDYGWADEDEGELPAMPPQTQGSEDILVPAPEELQGEEDEEGFLGEVVDSEDELAL